MNSLSIIFSYSFALDSATLNWYDIWIAIDNGFLPHQSAIEHAVSQLPQEEDYSQAVLDLACLSSDEAVYPHSIQPYINELANEVSEQEKDITKQKMLYLVLKWIFEHRCDYEDPLEVVEVIYADFDYPKTVSNFVRYMPMTQPDLGSVELNSKRLFNNWANYLKEQKVVFAK
jgi:hypothetical protein